MGGRADGRQEQQQKGEQGRTGKQRSEPRPRRQRAPQQPKGRRPDAHRRRQGAGGRREAAARRQVAKEGWRVGHGTVIARLKCHNYGSCLPLSGAREYISKAGSMPTQYRNDQRPNADRSMSAVPLWSKVDNSCQSWGALDAGGSSPSTWWSKAHAAPQWRTKETTSSDGLPPASKARGQREAPASAYRLRLPAAAEAAARPALRAR